MMQRVRVGLLASLLAVAACVDAPTEPRVSALDAPSLSRAGYGSVACTTTGATVVTTETALRATLTAAQPGDIVAIDGMITLASTVEVEVPEGVTLTCASGGSGVTATRWRSVMIYTDSPNSTISGLVIQGRNSDWPVYLINGFERADVADVTVAGNTVDCGWAGCAFIIGAPRTTVTGNSFTAVRFMASGIHLQGNGSLKIDGTRVENNVVTTPVPAGVATFGAIRPRDGTGVVVRDNVIRGPWSNGVASVLLKDAVLERNVVEGATRFGMFLSAEVRGSLFRLNDLTSVGGPAIFAQGACGNVFVANRLTPRVGSPGIAFGAGTGANAILGPARDVEDNGNRDCDGDGDIDPNLIDGKSRRGGHMGDVVGPVMQAAGSHAQ